MILICWKTACFKLHLYSLSSLDFKTFNSSKIAKHLEELLEKYLPNKTLLPGFIVYLYSLLVLLIVKAALFFISKGVLPIQVNVKMYIVYKLTTLCLNYAYFTCYIS